MPIDKKDFVFNTIEDFLLKIYSSVLTVSLYGSLAYHKPNEYDPSESDVDIMVLVNKKKDLSELFKFLKLGEECQDYWNKEYNPILDLRFFWYKRKMSILLATPNSIDEICEEKNKHITTYKKPREYYGTIGGKWNYTVFGFESETSRTALNTPLKEGYLVTTENNSYDDDIYYLPLMQEIIATQFDIIREQSLIEMRKKIIERVKKNSNGKDCLSLFRHRLTRWNDEYTKMMRERFT